MSKLRFIALILVIAVVATSLLMLDGDSDRWPDNALFDYGEPTPLKADEPMRVAVCQIRAELSELPEPIVAEHIYHPAWTERRLAAGEFKYGSAHELRLSEHALAFSLRHSRAELIAALSPLLLDAKDGGRAAAILAGLPARSKAALHNTSRLAKAVWDAQGRSASAPIAWTALQQAMRYEPPIPIGLYGLTNMGSRLERAAPRRFHGSFEERLEDVLGAQADLPLQLVQLAEPIGQPRKTFVELLESHPGPVVDKKLITFLESWPREEVLIALFPLLRDRGPDRGGSPLIELIWATGSEDRYWPLVVGQPLIEGDPFADFALEIAQELIDLCATGQESGTHPAQ